MRRVVVTGIGAVSPLGSGTTSSWRNLLRGESGVSCLPEEFCSDLAVKVGGLVPDVGELDGFDPGSVVNARDQKKMDRFILFALAAAGEALSMACYEPQSDYERSRTATIVASGIGGFPAIVDAVRTLDSRGPRRLSPFTVPSFLVNLAAGWISIRFGLRGPIGAPVSACAAGVQAIGDATRLIRCDEVDVAICGGTEACIDRVSLASFSAARALSTLHNDNPRLASRPFDRDRDGFVMGEGAGLLVIEALEHATARGAKPLAEIVGYGTSADAYHITSGAADGRGPIQAMTAALAQAGLNSGQVQHVNAHATSTEAGDACELTALRHMFGSNAGPAISATKAATGHLLGAAGGIEAVFSVLSILHQIAPPTINLRNPDQLAEGLDLVGEKARPMRIEHVLSNGFGFGGVNASVIFKAWQV